MDYYNENDPYCVEWLKNLIAGGLIPKGDVDGRDIQDVKAGDLNGYTRCHFFAGIGGWAYAAELAGWPGDRQLWTGSPPCQDNSIANIIWGERLGTNGTRSGTVHPWLGLVQGVRPPAIFFENVPGIEPWLAQIKGRLESFGYTVSRQDRSAASAGAPHLRRRVWLVADIDGKRLQEPRQAGPPKAPGIPWRTAPGDLWGTAAGCGGLLDGWISNRVAAVRAFGNAVVPYAAAEVIRAFMETE